MSGVFMPINERTASQLVDCAAEAMAGNADTFPAILDDLPAPIYVTDAEGTISYYNQACVELAGRRPAIGIDKWCVTFKLYTMAGDYLPHEQCPMAVAIRERRAVRDIEAVAERPDGSRIHFAPFPTPFFDENGDLAGAVNLLVEVSEKHKPHYLRAHASRCRELAEGIGDHMIAETLVLMAAKYDEQSLRLARPRTAANE